ncbi:MAG: bifunctional phosphoglucose/phosphomannose isomerase [Promethearchaeota archaeon]
MGNFSSLDKSDMMVLVESFPLMLKSLKPNQTIIQKAKSLRKSKLKGVCIVGMGGSSIAGSVCKGILQDSIDLPILIHRDYGLPRFVDKEWAVLVVSYSGNTEETISSFQEARHRNCPVFAFTSGGRILEEAPDESLQELPVGFPPRGAFPMIMALLLPILETLVGVDPTPMDDAAGSLAEQAKNWDSLELSPKRIAERILGKTSLFIGWKHLSQVAYRAKCQINENAKMASFHAELPEANHNEIEAIGAYEPFSIQPILLRSCFEDKTAETRFKATAALINETGIPPMQIKLEAKDRFSEALCMIHFLDMVSVELAELRGVNSLEVPRITKLKDEL